VVLIALGGQRLPEAIKINMTLTRPGFRSLAAGKGMIFLSRTERAHCPGTGDTHRGVERVERRSLPGRVGPVERPGPCQPNLIAPVPALVP
jgi:hypothetical protein